MARSRPPRASRRRRQLPDSVGAQPPNVQNAFKQALRFLKRPYVTGVCVGFPRKGGVQLDEIAICVLVRQKKPLEVLRPAQRFPRSIGGVRLDVEAYHPKPRHAMPGAMLQPGEGISISVGEGFGTLGLVVRHRQSGADCILTAGHVLLNVGRMVYVAGGLSAGEQVGRVLDVVMNGHGDGGIARITDHWELQLNPLGLPQAPIGTRPAVLGEVLTKSGAQTGITSAKVAKVGFFEIDYNSGSVVMGGCTLEPQLANVHEISEEGDSGSVWFDDAGLAVGMTVAGDRGGATNPAEVALACELGPLLERLKVDIKLADE